MKKLLTILLASFMLLTACSSNSDKSTNASNEGTNGGSTGKKQEITVWAWDKAFNIAAMETAKGIYAQKMLM